MTIEFAQRTRERIAEARTALTRLRDVGRETVKQLERIRRQQSADQQRVSEKLRAMADDIKMPDEMTEADLARAQELYDHLNELAGSVEEIYLAGSAIDDLASIADITRDA